MPSSMSSAKDKTDSSLGDTRGRVCSMPIFHPKQVSAKARNVRGIFSMYSGNRSTFLLISRRSSSFLCLDRRISSTPSQICKSLRVIVAAAWTNAMRSFSPDAKAAIAAAYYPANGKRRALLSRPTSFLPLAAATPSEPG